MKNNTLATAPVPVFPTEEIQRAIQLTDQYRKAISGTREVLIFGAMMCELCSFLQLQKAPSGNNQYTPKGDTVKGWIEENCPSINYNTAYKFYELAKRLREALSIPLATNIHRLLTAPVEALSKKEATIRAEMDGAIDGKSARQLEIDFGIRKARLALPASGGSREGSGRKPASLTRELADAEAFFSKEMLGGLGVAILEKRWHVKVEKDTRDVLLGIALAIAEDLSEPGLKETIREARSKIILAPLKI